MQYRIAIQLLKDVGASRVWNLSVEERLMIECDLEAPLHFWVAPAPCVGAVYGPVTRACVPLHPGGCSARRVDYTMPQGSTWFT